MPPIIGIDCFMDQNEILTRARQYVAAEKHELFRNEVAGLLEGENREDLRDRFYMDLVFGTGGMRGMMGGGYNRVNPFVIQRTTQGLANYMLKNASGDSQASVVVAHDSRNYSDLFALETARVLCANGIKTYLFSGLRPTPELSFAVRRLGATAGVVVTASHNPPEYNGYKIYWSDGGQIVPPHDTGIVEEVRAVVDVAVMDQDEAFEKGLLVSIDREVDDAFVEMVKGLSIRQKLVRERGKDLTVIYTPLHGAGAMPVSRVLGEMGIDVVFVEEQKEPDGNFPTVKSPNPEEASALAMAIDLAGKHEADLVLATDPDADRLGIAVPDAGQYRLLTGNQLGALLADYIFSSRKEMGTLPEKPVFIKTIVTTELQRRIAETYGACCIDVLTGFKYIGAKIHEFEEDGSGRQYVFGGEESYGYLVGDAVRDKDAVSAAAMTAEMTLYHASRGRSLVGQLNAIYEKYGYFQEILVSKVLKGEAGLNAMRELMNTLRESPPESFAGQSVVTLKDYLHGTVLDMRTGENAGSISLPSSNVLQFELQDRTLVTVRPSGTEPKVKFYASCCAEPGADPATARCAVQERLDAVRDAIDHLVPGR